MAGGGGGGGGGLGRISGRNREWVTRVLDWASCLILGINKTFARQKCLTSRSKHFVRFITRTLWWFPARVSSVTAWLSLSSQQNHGVGLKSF